MKKKYLIYAILPITAFAVLGAAYAIADTVESNNPMSDLVNAIAERFNLNVSDVQSVFDEQRVKMEAQREEQRVQMEERRQQEFTNRLNQAVADGELTQDQADEILTKRAELETRKTNIESMTPEERQTVMKEEMDSLKQWATDNGIPEEYLPFLGFGMGRARHGGPGGPGFWGPPPDQPCDNATSAAE